MAESHYSLIIIGGGLSGLAAGIRYARFGESVLILEKHTIPGGLNSYYYRKNFLLETGLHAMTNYAASQDRHAPLNRLFRQLNLSRKKFVTHEQFSSQILFPNKLSLSFNNDINLLRKEIAEKFPASIDDFEKLISTVVEYDPFTPKVWVSTRKILKEIIKDSILIDMLLFPLMIYGNSEEHDMDFSQFVIMFRSIFLEGLFRPDGTIKDFLNLLIEKFESYGGKIQYRSQVQSIKTDGTKTVGVTLSDQRMLTCDSIISTVGSPGTEMLLGGIKKESFPAGKMSFVESIYVLPIKDIENIKSDQTIIFYSLAEKFNYCRPIEPIDPYWGVVCFPQNFKDLPDVDYFQIRITNSANYDLWKNVNTSEYKQMKKEWGNTSRQVVEEIIGNFSKNIVYEDSFTPVTIEKYTAKQNGAVYGCPIKVKDGKTDFDNLFIAGTDQGYLGIIGSMLSGVTVVNQNLLANN